MSEQNPKYKVIEASELKQGPIRHQSLPQSFLTRAFITYEVFGDAIEMTFEQFIDNFLRDQDPERELRVWEHIAGTFVLITRESKTLPRDIFHKLINWSMLSTPETANDPEFDIYRNYLTRFFNSLLDSIHNNNE
jgi:hypothetical protein